MKKRTREIVALALLVVLGLGIGCAMAWYIMVGHSWNVTATHIDDYVGEMEGYTVVVFDGCTERFNLPKSSSRAQRGAVGQKNREASQGDARVESEPRDGDAMEAQRVESAFAVLPRIAESAMGLPVYNMIPHTRFDARAVAEGYRSKKADVVVIYPLNADIYSDPWVFKRGAKRIGVFSVASSYDFARAARNTAYLKRCRVDMIVAIAQGKSAAGMRMRGVDVVVYPFDAPIAPEGERIGGSFCVDSPYKGQVRAVIVSPSNVMTAKTLERL